jgi:hypothetical protein
MISLTKKMARRDVTGFLVATGIVSFVLGLIVLWALLESWPVAVLASGVGALSFVGAGLYSEAFSIVAYRRWNQVAKRVASLVRWWVSSVAFHVIVRVAGRSSGITSQRALAAGRSFWRERSTLPAEAYAGQYNRVYRGDAEGGGWAVDYLRWCFASGNGWLVFLLPFLLVLRVVSGERVSELPENVYTLY